MVVQVSQAIPAQVISKVVVIVIHNAIIVAIVFIVKLVQLVQLVIVVTNVQIVKRATHNAIQIISDYFYDLLYYFFTADVNTYKLFINCLNNIVNYKFDNQYIYYNLHKNHNLYSLHKYYSLYKQHNLYKVKNQLGN